MNKTLYEKDVPDFLSFFISIFIWTIAIFYTIFFYLVSLIFVEPIAFLRDRGTRAGVHRVSGVWAKSIMACVPLWKIRVIGQENVVPGKNYVVVANHQSLMDILMVLAGLPKCVHFKFIAKKELFPIPFIGWHMSLAKYIPLDRSSRESGKNTVLAARQWLRKGVSVLFYPEGTRSLDGEIHVFKVGAFKLANDEKVDVLPVVIDGTANIVPKKSWMLKRFSLLTLSIGKPVSVHAHPSQSIEAVRDEVRQEMVERLAKIRSER